jgi:lipopolysaccharide export system protein LptA
MILISLLISIPAFAQKERQMITVNGDSLFGKMINGEMVREVHGNVVMTQGNVRITCLKAIQYLVRNEAELIGKVVVKQDSVIINTDIGYYYGDTKVAHSKSGISLFDGHVNLSSKNGYYYFDEKRAFFYDNVKLYDQLTNLQSDRLTYYNDEDKAVAAGNVEVRDSSSILFADSLTHFRDTKISFAYNNVLIYDPKNRLAIFADRLEDYNNQNYTKIYDNPFLVKVDTTDDGQLDTLVISSKLMESYDDSTKRVVATDSVLIARKDFASINDITILYRNSDYLYTYKPENATSQPVMWNENTQLIGDSINVYLQNNKLKRLLINSNASIISSNEKYEFKYDQISGMNIEMMFGENGLERTEVTGSVLSIYYLFEDDEPNGLLKSSSDRTIIFFEENAVTEVKFYGNPASEYHPENLIEGKEKEFTIPSFIIIKNRPTKESIIGNRANKIFSKLNKLQSYGK